MGAGAQLARRRALRLLGIEVQPHRADMPVGLVDEKVLVAIHRQCRQSQHQADDGFHLGVVPRCGLAYAVAWVAWAAWRLRPKVGNEIALAFGARIVRLVRPGFATDVVEFLEIRWRSAGIGASQCFDAERAIAAWRIRDRVDRLALLVQRQREEGVRA
jgi:hypothetical protein